MKKQTQALYYKYPSSAPCSCKICNGFCQRPGWWTVDECRAAISEGLARFMMLELSPDHTFGVLSPAFRGNEGFYALKKYANNGCTFLENNKCKLHGSGLQPLECRFCHHERKGLGNACHQAIESNWDTRKGKRLIVAWLDLMKIFNVFQTQQYTSSVIR